MKKAQAAEGATALVTVIMVILVLYILFIPSEDRDKLLNETEKKTSGTTVAESKTLVFEHPGLLDYLRETEREHSIPSVNLYTETKATVLKEIDSFYIKNGWFNKQVYNMAFNIAEVANVENALLSFNIKQTHGRLIVKLNGEQLFNAQVALGNANPIKLPNNLLKNTNIIEFSVSGTGVMFWSLNEYNLESVKVTADITDMSKRTSENIFIVSNTEKGNLDETSLRFAPDCLASEVGKLTVDINGKEVYSAVPDCGLPSTVQFLSDYIKAGENRIKFSTTEGRYFIDYITIKLKLKEIAYPIYYFELEQDELDDLTDEEANVTLYMEFVDGDNKRADVIVNGHKTYMETSDSDYNKTIDYHFLEEGNNYVKIEPRTALNIVDLKVLWNS